MLKAFVNILNKGRHFIYKLILYPPVVAIDVIGGPKVIQKHQVQSSLKAL